MMTVHPSTIANQLFGPLTAAPPLFSTPAVIGAMLDSGGGISDLIFSPGRPPQVEKHGELSPVNMQELSALHPPDTARLARDIIGDNPIALRALQDQGASDLSYSLAERARFRVNVFRQRGSFAIVMRVIAPRIPTLAELGLPKALADIAPLKNGIVLVTGPTGSGKSTTLAAVIDLINETRADQLLTIEDPIEFLHNHKKATIHQRELHSDTPTFALALRAALRQAPKVILVWRYALLRDDRDRPDRRRDRVTSSSPRCTPSTPRRPSSASSAPSIPAISTRFAAASPRRSATSCRSACSRRRAAAASPCSRS